MKKIIEKLVLLAIISAIILPGVVLATSHNLPGSLVNLQNVEYQELVPLPEFRPGGADTANNPIQYIENVYYFTLAAAVVLAVIMLVIAGIEYTTYGVSEAAKTRAKSRINYAIGGLILALSSWLILNLINPQLVGGNIFLPDASRTGDTQDGSGIVRYTGAGVDQRCVEDEARSRGGVYPPLNLASNNIKVIISYVQSELDKGNAEGKTFNGTPYPTSDILGEISTYQKSGFEECNALRGHPFCGVTSCIHSKNSAHYPKKADEGTNFYGSNAVDFGMGGGFNDGTQEYGDLVISLAKEAAEQLGISIEAFCENNGSKVVCSTGISDHIHIQISP